MTHRVFSRNASSSRAIPVAKVIEQVRNDPFIPSHIYMNQSGMVGTVEASEDTYESFKGLWLKAVDSAVTVAESMVALGVHKHTSTESLNHSSTLTWLLHATEWENFLHLRLASDAQPEMQDLARAIKGEMDKVGNKIISVYRYLWEVC